MAASKQLVQGIALYNYKNTQPQDNGIVYTEDNLSGEIFYKYYKDGALKEGKTYAEVLDFNHAGGKGTNRTNQEINTIKELLYNIVFNPELIPLDQKAKLELARMKRDRNAIYIDEERHECKIRAIENALSQYQSCWSNPAEAEKGVKDALSMHRGRWLFTLFSAPTSARVLPSATENCPLQVVSQKR